MVNLLKLLFVFAIFISFTPLNVYAELYEETIERPYGHAQYSRGYTENDEDQIKESFRPSFFSKSSYNVYLPNGETDNMPYKRPAVLLLHGAERTGASLVERWREISDDEDVILIGPTAKGGRWKGGNAYNLIPALLDDAIEKYNIDEKRIYVFGHSNGAVFTLALAPILSERFAAAGIHAGKFRDYATEKVVEDAKRDIPLFIINGTRDEGFPLHEVQKVAKTFDKNGHDVEFYTIDDHGHWYYDIAADINELAWDFFEDYKLD